MQFAFYFDQTRCTECGTCTVACKDWNGVKPGEVKWRKIIKHDRREEGEFPDIKFRPLIYSCMHCSSPACVQSCPAGAIIKRSEDGIVLVNRMKCQSYKICIDACPYGAIQIAGDEQEAPQYGWLVDHPAQKCTFCVERIEKGDKPACVASCPQRALDIGSPEELSLRYPSAVIATEDESIPDDMYAGQHTKPNMYIRKRV
jgi:anaerobic dimethyl sulfoxide reductase subunit B (iron-sulfur subunit)